MFKIKALYLIISVVVIFLTTCGSSVVSENREKEILKNYTVETKKQFNDLLVNLGSYTTNGAIYQKKYYKYLIGIAGDIVKKKNLVIVKQSLGFYYDKKSKDFNSLYLGFDIDTEKNFSQRFESVSIMLLKNDLKSVIDTMNSCKSIFNEQEIVGMVIGWKWINDGSSNYVNIWIKERDIIRFEESSLTFDELIQRSTITDTAGRIIRLQI